MLLHVERHQEDQDHEVRADLAETTNAWSGKHHFITWLKPPGGNPLRAVFFLQGHLFDDHKKMVKGIQMICKMFEKYLCCVLWCNMGPEAAETAYKVLRTHKSCVKMTNTSDWRQWYDTTAAILRQTGGCASSCNCEAGTLQYHRMVFYTRRTNE